MNKLFIELYLDEDVSVLVAELLRARGYSAVTAREVGRRGSTDLSQLEYAASQGKALVTHNRVDFEELARLYLESGKPHFGIIIAVRRSAHEMVRRLLLLLNSVTADELQNQVRYI